jgi:UDP-N-acetylmuramoyl-tripeptide--D-alanyl-D-alanine ligase
MEKFSLSDLKNSIHGKTKNKTGEIFFNGVSIDTRTIKKGDVYFAIKGKKFDGHDFIEQAVKNGAGAVVYSMDNYGNNIDFKKTTMIKVDCVLTALGNFAKFYRQKFNNIKIIGITGSNGKTTTKEILTSILKQKGETISNKGNFNNRIGLPFSVFNLSRGNKYGVFEMGTSLFGEIKILADILKPTAAIITNIGHSHLETFENPEGVFKEKKSLFESIEHDGFIVRNNDNIFLRQYKNNDTKIVSFAINSQADVCARKIKVLKEKLSFDIFYKNKKINILMPAKGVFNVYNALAAASCALEFGFSLEEIKRGIEIFELPKMRMETLAAKSGTVLINDSYNANPSSMEESIKAVCQSYKEKKICLILGDMLELGKDEEKYHRELGKFVAKQNVALVFCVGKLMSFTKESIEKENGKIKTFHCITGGGLLKDICKIRGKKNFVFLFKGSRKMELEIVCSDFLSFLNSQKL